MATTSTKPYFLRALYEWCVDQNLTPYLLVSVDKQTMVPRGFVQDGQITLNIGPVASNQLQMGNELITFQARFSGQVQNLSIPVSNVLALYAKETGEGMGFELETADADNDAELKTEEVATEPPPEEPTPPKRPRLSVVK